MTAADLTSLFLERVVGRDADALAELFVEHIDWYVPGHDAIPWTGSRTKRGDVLAYVRTIWSEVEPGGSSVRVDKVLVDGDDAVVFVNLAHTFRRTQRRFSGAAAVHFAASGDKLVKMHLYEDTEAVATPSSTVPRLPPEH
ncbi:MAG TPA: nuclear transport factor 2 family protein [Solirubrobacteraceae bacterium]|nr:nuclear transport factor 2 family protein [Solirubrobacteraceae bacterium]